MAITGPEMEKIGLKALEYAMNEKLFKACQEFGSDLIKLKLTDDQVRECVESLFVSAQAAVITRIRNAGR